MVILLFDTICISNTSLPLLLLNLIGQSCLFAIFVKSQSAFINYKNT
jgi:hypothetical protein